VPASWLNPVEISFALIQRQVLTPNDFASLVAVEERLRLYQERTNRGPQPFEWRFDRDKWSRFLARLEARRVVQEQAQAAAKQRAAHAESQPYS